MPRRKGKQRSASLRLLQYLRPYRGRLLLTAALMAGFALTSGISIGMISPFVKILFTPRPVTAPAVVGPPMPGAPAATPPANGPVIPGIGAVSSLPGMASDHAASVGGAKSPETISSRISEWKRGLRTWFEHFF